LAPALDKEKSVTHVAGLLCHLCLRPFIDVET
jgi:hypothetical protein